MSKELNLEDFNYLKPYEPHLTRGTYGRYVYGLRRSDFNALYAKYKELGYGQTMEYSCNRCLLNLTSTLGKLYFDFKAKQEENPEPTKNAKRKVGTFNNENELINEFDSVTQAISETGVSKGNVYKSLKDNTPVDGVTFRYI